MNSDSLNKLLNSILNTLPRILAPWEAIQEKLTKNWEKMNKKIKKIVKSQRSRLDFHHLTVFFQCHEYVAQKETKKWKVNEKL